MTLKTDLNTGPNHHYSALGAEKLVCKLLTMVLYHRISFRKGRGYIGFLGDFRLEKFKIFFKKFSGPHGAQGHGPQGPGAQGHGPQEPMGLKDPWAWASRTQASRTQGPMGALGGAQKYFLLVYKKYINISFLFKV